MSLYHPLHTQHISHTDSYQALLHSETSEKYLLIIGPGILSSTAHAKGPPLLTLLESMLSCCLQADTMHHHTTSTDVQAHARDDLPPQAVLRQLGYTLEEHLAGKQQLCDCLQTALSHYLPSQEIRYLLTHKPFRGYITTSYDTFVEHAYASVWQTSLPKFYPASIGGAVAACRNAHPFILKLYGDVDEPNSIILGSRFIKKLSRIDQYEQLQTLLSLAPAIFIGFEEADPDREILEHLVRVPDLSRGIHPPEPSSLKHVHRQTEQQPFCYEAAQDLSPVPTNAPFSETFIPMHMAIKDIRPPWSSENEWETQFSPIAPQAQNKTAIEIFTAYASQDEKYRGDIELILGTLRRQGWSLIPAWCEVAEDTFSWKMDNRLETAGLLLLLVSAEFLNTDFCYSQKLDSAIKQLRARDYRCILPIVCRPVPPSFLQATPFSDLLHLPPDGKPIKGRRDQALAALGDYIKNLLESLKYY